jgi:hypothetical protein
MTIVAVRLSKFSLQVDCGLAENPYSALRGCPYTPSHWLGKLTVGPGINSFVNILASGMVELWL